MRVTGRLTLLLALAGAATAATRAFDVVVYGGTAGGVMAAVSAGRQGLKTALVEPTGHLGGMVSGGLSWTDYGKKEVVGGYALEFYWRAGVHYQMARYGNEVSWLHEPHVAESIFREMLSAAGVTVFERQRLREKNGVRKNGTTVEAITTEDGTEFTAAIFVDAGYEGDLMGQAGVTWTYGREGQAQYGESLAGVREKTPFHQFLVDVSPYAESGAANVRERALLPEISAAKLEPAGAPDKKVQAYNYRMCFTDLPENRRAWSKPARYDAARYALLPRLIAAQIKKEGRTPPLSTYLKIDRIMLNKADVNNNGAFSTDYIGGSYEYPTASYAKRDEIWQAHRDYIAGLFYFLATDPQVPDALRREMNQWGLCRDEWVDNDNWPNQLYIRESRRMVGEYVVVQKDLQTDLTKPDPIGMGSYNSDSHNIQRVVDTDGFVRNEGDMQVAVKPYQIPYRVILPKRAEARNLLVTAAFSASHVAYSSLRMEPQYMIIGQAAGVAAKLAISNKQSVQEVDTAKLTGILRQQGAILEYVPNANTPILQIIRRPGIR